jgi:hypothetical protein
VAYKIAGVCLPKQPHKGDSKKMAVVAPDITSAFNAGRQSKGRKALMFTPRILSHKSPKQIADHVIRATHMN